MGAAPDSITITTMNEAYLAVLRSTGGCTPSSTGTDPSTGISGRFFTSGADGADGRLDARPRPASGGVAPRVLVGYELLELALLVASVRVFEAEMLVDKLWT